MTVINIPELFSDIASKVNTALSTRASDPFSVYYDYGRYLEVTRNLTEKDGGKTTKGKKYPLIWVVVPYTVEESIAGYGCQITDLQIIIATLTDQAKTTPERIEANFIPRLYPVYEELISQIDNSGYFEDLNLSNFHRRTDQPYWDGKEGSSNANLFNDFIDAIHLKNIRLKVSEQTCERFRVIGA